MPLFDLQCSSCGHIAEHFVLHRGPKMFHVECDECGETVSHVKCPVQKPAFYLGDRPRAPMVAGGSVDTVGAKRPEVSMPEMSDAQLETTAGVQDFYRSKHWKEYEKSNAATKKENAAKKERARLIKSGANIDMRSNPLPGDPKF